MSRAPSSNFSDGLSVKSLDDAEKGLAELPAPPGFVYMDPKKCLATASSVSLSSIPHGITPTQSVPELSLTLLPGEKPTDASALETTVKEPPKDKPQKPKISRWVLFNLWFNTYRKFFIFVTVLNLVGIILAACNIFHYAENHLGALVLGNLLCAILMRNELFLRILYMIAIHGLSVSIQTLVTSLCVVCPTADGLGNSGHRYPSN